MVLVLPGGAAGVAFAGVDRVLPPADVRLVVSSQ